MATERRRKNAPVEEAAKNDFEALADSIKANPLAYAVFAAFVAVCLVAGFAYRAHSNAKSKEVGSAYVRALDTEDPSLQAAELEQLSGAKGDLAAEVAHMAAEAAYRAGESDKAKEGFERVRSEYPESPHAPDAVEGLGFIAEDGEDYAGAMALYQEVMEKWGLSFTARRQLLNVGRCKERLGQLAEAVTAYQEQVETFPGSNVAADAQAALERLRESDPDLFPEEEPEIADEASGDEASGDEAPAETQAVGEVKLAPETEEAAVPESADASESDETAAPADETESAPEDAGSDSESK